MLAGANPAVRHCSTCEKSVYFVDDLHSLKAHASLGRCVAARVGGVTIAGAPDAIDAKRLVGVLGPPDDTSELRAALKRVKIHSKS